MDDDDARLVAVMAEELQIKAPAYMDISFEPASVLKFAGLLQLALRHPGLSPDVRTTAEKFLGGARAYFADCPAVLEALRRGDDPNEDR